LSKQSLREEAERLIRESMEKKTIVVKCGAPNRVQAEKGQSRVKFACKNCGHQQETL
jgi:predicted RNA-binding Zn-ribbon protein involved in translation (DUF1610 family)